MAEYFQVARVTFDSSKYDARLANVDTQVAKIKAVTDMRAVRVVRVADKHESQWVICRDSKLRHLP